MIEITIVTTKGCSNCAHAKEILNKLKSKYSLEINEINAESDKGQELIQKYNILSSPGILINNKFFSMGAITEEQLVNKFEQIIK